jgi:hypothetical protein
MSDIAQTLVALDELLQVFGNPDSDSAVSELEPSRRAAVKREEDFEHVMKLASVEQLRMYHISKLIEQSSKGCAEYLYALVRVHAGYELTYHELLSGICDGHHPSLYSGDEILPYWQTWWTKHGKNPSYSSLNWMDDSKNLRAALNALTSDDADMVASLLYHTHSLVRQSIARRPAFNEEWQYQLADDPDPAVRFALAQNRGTSPEVLAELGNDLSSIVRRWVACHPSTPQRVLDRLNADPIDGVRDVLAKRRT